MAAAMSHPAYGKAITKEILRWRNKHPRLEHNVTLATMKLNNSTFISENYDKSNQLKE